MLQPDVVTRLRLLAESPRVPEAAQGDRVQQVDALRPGEAVSARIERELPNGRHLVALRGRLFEMQLPPGMRAREELRLAFLTDPPRPTFSLHNGGSRDEGDRLSQTGRLISALMQTAGDPPRAPLRPAGPLLMHGPADAGQAAVVLREALSNSGLFYESHQAQWVAGTRALEQLRREPQARLTGSTPAPDAAPDAAGDGPRLAELRSGPVHPDALPIVRQQLETLEHRHALWQGEIWPQQWIDWQTGQDETEPHGADGQPAWFSTLALELPSLGKVRLRAVLASGGVRVSVECADADVAARMRAAAAPLAEALQARGLTLAALAVKPAQERAGD